MSTFSEALQRMARKAFIEEYRQKVWGAACHADWIRLSLDALMGEFQKLQAEDRELEAQFKKEEDALDYHTVDSRNRRKGISEQRHKLGQQMNKISEDVQQGYQAMQRLLQSVETSLALAKHAETWEWKEVAGVH
jgi:hypothetical protein